ncbi:TPM domain-containing protein [Ruminococcus sp.]|uniref:TPM domain-containing protein n=1 Tax=Ruminococcus sp. TaxID=41978 RepID=UPI0026010199|nr:TPM domain-containing protein [Ruminococcus sp.]MCR4637836.1 TPM domain-containing protein [Ruminococcus sp.]
MKKFLSAAFFAASVALTICSCSSKSSSFYEPKNKIETTSQPFTEREVRAAEGSYVYDKAGILSPEDIKACNDYAGWLYNEKLVNAAVITVNELGDKSPYDYAAEAFADIYEAKGSGMIILINNDTNEDVVFKTGNCLTNISDKAQENSVYWATKEIMRGDYRRGIMRLLQLGELCPAHIADNVQLFEYEQSRVLEKALASCKDDITLLASKNNSSAPNEEILKTYYKRKYIDRDGIMLMIDTKSKKMIAYSDKKTPKELETALKSANELTAKDDYYGAVNKIVEALDGKAASDKKE